MDIEILKHRCQPFLYRRSGCRLCIEACPQGCITFPQDSPSIDEEKCTSCGICTSACPSGAFRVKGFDDIALWERLKGLTEGKEYVVLTCSNEEEVRSARLKRGSALVGFSCVGLIKDAHILGLFLSGVKGVTIRKACKDCTSPQGSKVVLRTVENVKTLLEALGVEGEISLTPDLPEVEEGVVVDMERIESKPHYSRREFLSLFRDRVKDLKEELEEDEEEEDEYQEVRFLPDEDLPEGRRLLINLLKGGERGLEATLERGSYPIYEMEIDDRCTLCNICDLFCPTGAINRVDEDKGVRIDFTPAFCVSCYQCEDLCPEGTLHARHGVPLGNLVRDEAVTLHSRDKMPCSSCGKLFLPRGEETVCMSCDKKRKREELFFAMIGVED